MNRHASENGRATIGRWGIFSRLWKASPRIVPMLGNLRARGARIVCHTAVAAAVFYLVPRASLAIDPPHYIVQNGDICVACHATHGAAGGSLTTRSGNGNLCLSCHAVGGQAPTNAFVNADQAIAWPGIPAGVTNAGTSHRWDSSIFAGRAVFVGGSATPSTGSITPTGVYVGAYAKTYLVSITASGQVGVAKFNWTTTKPGDAAGTNVTTAASVNLNEGISLVFTNGSVTTTAFRVNDQWQVFVRSDLSFPTNEAIAFALTNQNSGVAFCSACHDQHSQQFAPFDTNAPAYAGGGGVGAGGTSWSHRTMPTSCATIAMRHVM